MDLNRADMKLLVECGYSGVLRNIDVPLMPIFEALEIWMPEQGAGTIGRALIAMVDGRIVDAAALLEGLIASERQGRDEARAILAMCRALQKDTPAMEKLARDLEGHGGPAEGFASLLVSSGAETAREDQGSASTTIGQVRAPAVSGQRAE